jgi:hypothetical protein
MPSWRSVVQKLRNAWALSGVDLRMAPRARRVERREKASPAETTENGPAIYRRAKVDQIRPSPAGAKANNSESERAKSFFAGSDAAAWGKCSRCPLGNQVCQRIERRPCSNPVHPRVVGSWERGLQAASARASQGIWNIQPKPGSERHRSAVNGALVRL